MIQIIYKILTNLQMEGQLQHLEKQRIRWYKEHLKAELDRSKQFQKYTNSYEKKKNQRSSNEFIDILKKQDEKRMNDRRKFQYLLKQQNHQLVKMRKSGFYFQEAQFNNYPKLSFIQKLSEQDKQRLNRLKLQQKYRKGINLKQTDFKRNHEKRMKFDERFSQFSHLKTIDLLDDMRKKQYSAHLKKHTQNMNIYNHSEQFIQQKKDKYKNQAERFTKASNDIFSKKLYRNQSSERRNNAIQCQQEIEKQVEQTNKKRHKTQQDKTESKLKESFLESYQKQQLDNRRKHAEFLSRQIGEKRMLKNLQKEYNSQKYEVHGLLGGQHGRQRMKMIKYIDDRLGIKPKNQINVSQNITSKQKIEKLPQTQIKKIPQQLSIKSSEKSQALPHENKKQETSSQNVYRTFDIVTCQTRYYNP